MIIEPSDQIQTFEFHLCKNLNQQLPTFFFWFAVRLVCYKKFRQSRNEYCSCYKENLRFYVIYYFVSFLLLIFYKFIGNVKKKKEILNMKF